MQKKFIPNHLHLLIRGYILNAPKNENDLNVFLKSLVEKVRMKVVAGPTSVYIEDEGNEGVTGTVTLATSHASMHVWDSDSPSMFQFDIYSCSTFTASEILDHIDLYFKLVDYTYWFIDRNGNKFELKDYV